VLERGIYMNFENLSLTKPLLRAVREQGYESPSPIQRQAIPIVLKGVDLLASAQEKRQHLHYLFCSD
jgi:superfamily II DNA/RNA helicase